MIMYFRRAIEGTLLGPISHNKIRLLFGARQTGKTSLLLEALPPERTLFINLAAPNERRRYEAEAHSSTTSRSSTSR